MKIRKFIKYTTLVVLLILIVGIVYGSFFYISATKDIVLDKDALTTTYALADIFDDSGSKISYSNDTKYVQHADISINIINAFVALEDKRFYKHNGIDYIRTVGALVNNLKVGYSAQGGSTITQQLAKNSMLTNDKTYERKLQEWKLAQAIEKTYSKDEIIEMYLNIIYFGNGIYGIESACEEIFAKSPADLSIAESAMLAGIVKNPRDNSPLSYPENATERMQLVLTVIFNEGYIDETELKTAQTYQYSAPQVDTTSTFVSNYGDIALQEASKILAIDESDVMASNLNIYTYCDIELQEYLGKLLENPNLHTDCNADIMALVTDNATGSVLGYVSSSQYSATTLKRQPASTIKPILTYAPALDMGYIHPSSPINDEKVTINGYSPQNYGNNYLGWTDVRTAIMHSSNAVALSITDQVGLETCKKYAGQMGLTFSDNDKLATALGGMTNGVTLSELTEGYMTLANSGQHSDIAFISKITDDDGKVIYEHKVAYNKVISEESAYLLTDMLCDTAQSGTAKKLHTLGYDVAAKTGTAGTSQGNSDAICMSYTTKNTVGVWYGNNLQSGELMNTAITGGSYPTIFTREIYEYMEKPSSFTIPSGIIMQEVDTYATEHTKILSLASSNTPEEYIKNEIFDINTIDAIETSTFFDDIIPNDFTVSRIDGTIIIDFTPKKGFVYHIYRENNKKKDDLLISTTNIDDEYYNIIDSEADIGVNSYYLVAESCDGIICGKSKTARKLLFPKLI
ncbi:MAG: transglycosylase domain-containing protein [Bacillota bacterium]